MTTDVCTVALTVDDCIELDTLINYYVCKIVKLIGIN